MQLQPVLLAVQSALSAQGQLAGGDVAVEAAIDHLVQGLGPVLRQAAFDLAEQAAVEVRSQLPDRQVDVVLLDGDPALRITDAPVTDADPAAGEDLDARITLRVTPTLKTMIEDAAEAAGASINGWVLDALSKRARKGTDERGFRSTTTFGLSR